VSTPKPEVLNEWVTLYEGSALDVLPTLDRASIAAVVADPPYGVSYQSARRIDKSKRFDVLTGDDVPQSGWFAAVKPTLVETGCLLCFCEWKHSETFRTAMTVAGFHVGAQLVWNRVVPGMGDLTGRPSPAHDLIWFAVHGKYQLPGKRPSSVYTVQRLGGHELVHPTQKPVPLMARLIDDYAPAGGLILDPFAGSGTTAIAAMQTGRRCILIECDSRYCDTIRRRVDLASGTGPGSLFRTADDPALSLFDAPTLVEDFQ